MCSLFGNTSGKTIILRLEMDSHYVMECYILFSITNLNTVVQSKGTVILLKAVAYIRFTSSGCGQQWNQIRESSLLTS